MLLRSNSRFRSKLYNVLGEYVYKIALSANDNNRMQTPDVVISYPYGIGPGTVC